MEVEAGLFRFLAARVRDSHAARDLVQEVLAKAFRSRADYDESRPFRTWIFAIARNACIDFLRQRLRDPLSAIAPNAPSAPFDLDSLASHATPDPGEHAERQELIRVVREELRRLPDNRRAALEMKMLEGLTYREVSQALGVPLGTVAYWVREAVETISRRLEEKTR